MCTPGPRGDRGLVVVRTAEQRAIRVLQQAGNAGASNASVVAGPGSTFGGTTGACTGCVPDLRAGAPPTIDIVTATLTGSYCDTGATPLTVTLSGHLDLLAAPSFDDIMEINQPFGPKRAAPAFLSQGSDMVVTVDGAVGEPTATLPGYASCELTTPYHVDWYVERQNVKHRGLRNFRIEAQQTCCLTAGPGARVCM
jgi:hypothetical protein